ncbi:hypothetical protein LF887_20955 [Chryseobacterium sp. MEBOG06]|uniref:hypothetical protein n=1 Tax=unclassified Chryseobacterium TaxID=2593645 RepID=UPI001F17B2A7|nr:MULTISPECIES: hypothetical protein [unclassified Chryseobacterium]UKB83448.1 hypothetical protein LF887_20955 [Chryseobacterium sp. MEBOG06]
MEKTKKQQKAIEVTLKVLDQLKFQYGNTEEHLNFMNAIFYEKQKMYDGKEWSHYSVDFFHDVFDIPTVYYSVVDAETMQVKGIQTDHGVFEIIYNDKGEAKDKKFISPSFPYDKQ